MDLISFWYSLPVRRRAKSVGPGLRCHGPVSVSRRTVLGESVHFNGARIYGTGDVTFGRYVHSGEGLKIFTRNHNYNGGDAIPYDRTSVVKPVSIGDFAWIGAYVILLPGTKIGEGAIIQAGSVVHGEIPPLAIAGGNPAKVFAWRDREHYESLKAAGKFH
ncbi:MAG: acyltransferase [Kiritimatiellae bacterium]|nr:acyltransferase [Kiritimatiellia bacterium]